MSDALFNINSKFQTIQTGLGRYETLSNDEIAQWKGNVIYSKEFNDYLKLNSAKTVLAELHGVKEK
ncbi:MAG: hypothetical protein J6B11_10370 [Spirochaetales bacterium]|nr:hypothetical protein [Spirochaetales bacterium]